MIKKTGVFLLAGGWPFQTISVKKNLIIQGNKFFFEVWLSSTDSNKLQSASTLTSIEILSLPENKKMDFLYKLAIKKSLRKMFSHLFMSSVVYVIIFVL